MVALASLVAPASNLRTLRAAPVAAAHEEIGSVLKVDGASTAGDRAQRCRGVSDREPGIPASSERSN
jgi:hypothetical protein